MFSTINNLTVRVVVSGMGPQAEEEDSSQDALVPDHDSHDPDGMPPGPQTVGKLRLSAYVVVAMASHNRVPTTAQHTSHLCGHGKGSVLFIAFLLAWLSCLANGCMPVLCAAGMPPSRPYWKTGNSGWPGPCVNPAHLTFESPEANYGRQDCHRTLPAGTSCSKHTPPCISAFFTKQPYPHDGLKWVSCPWSACAGKEFALGKQAAARSLAHHVHSAHGGQYTHPVFPSAKSPTGWWVCPAAASEGCAMQFKCKSWMERHIESCHFIPIGGDEGNTVAVADVPTGTVRHTRTRAGKRRQADTPAGSEPGSDDSEKSY